MSIFVTEFLSTVAPVRVEPLVDGLPAPAALRVVDHVVVQEAAGAGYRGYFISFSFNFFYFLITFFVTI